MKALAAHANAEEEVSALFGSWVYRFMCPELL